MKTVVDLRMSAAQQDASSQRLPSLSTRAATLDGKTTHEENP